MSTTQARLAAFAAGLLVTVGAGCGNGTGPEGGQLPANKTRILFIGNSLTYVNDLPNLLVAIAAAAGDTMIATATVAFPDFSLEDHWGEGTAREYLSRNRYEFVVMQQGPSSLPENQALLRRWATEFAGPIRQAGATPVLYMVWPASDRRQDYPNVRKSYRDAAAAVQGIFAPAGDAWQIGLSRTPPPAVYGSDGFHPTLVGSYLAAITILGRIRNLDPTSLPPAIPGGGGLSAEEVRSLQAIAKEALDRNDARPTN